MTTTIDESLADCPFLHVVRGNDGQAASVVEQGEDFFVLCDICGAQGPCETDYAGAAKAWASMKEARYRRHRSAALQEAHAIISAHLDQHRNEWGPDIASCGCVTCKWTRRVEAALAKLGSMTTPRAHPATGGEAGTR